MKRLIVIIQIFFFFSYSYAEKLLLIIESNIYPEISEFLDQFIQDLNEDEIASVTYIYNEKIQGDNSNDLKELIQNYFTNNSIDGVLLVGDLPYAYFEIDNQSLITDVFFMDMDGKWDDIDNDGVLDSHEGDIQPEIYLSRIATHNLPILPYDEKDIIKLYLNKNHQYRLFGSQIDEMGLIYCDDFWAGWGNRWKKDMEAVIGSPQLYRDSLSTTKLDYISKLSDQYSISHIFTECSYDYQILTTNNSATYFTASDLIANPSKHQVMLFNGGSISNIEMENNLASLYLFTGDRTLNVIGCSSDGGFSYPYDFYKNLGRSFTIGESFKSWLTGFIRNGKVDILACKDFYGQILLGDPTIKVKRGFYFENILIDDSSNGDGDGLLDAGETANLVLKLSTSSWDVSSVSGFVTIDNNEISSNNQNLIFVKNPDGYFYNVNSFIVEASKNIKNKTNVNLNVKIEGYNQVSKKLTIFAPEITFYDLYIKESVIGNYDFEVIFKMTNSGNDDAENLTIIPISNESIEFEDVSYYEDFFAVGYIDSMTVYTKSNQSFGVADIQISADDFYINNKVLLNFMDEAVNVLSLPESSFMINSNDPNITNWHFNYSGNNTKTISCSNSFGYSPFMDTSLELPYIYIDEDIEIKLNMRMDCERYSDGGIIEIYENGVWKKIEFETDLIYEEFFNIGMKEPVSLLGLNGDEQIFESIILKTDSLDGFYKLRFRFITDGRIYGDGWFVNKVELHHTSDIIENLISENNLIFYPNPFNNYGVIKFNSELEDDYTISVYNSSGQKVYSTLFYAKKGSNLLSFDGSAFSSGVYYLEVKMDDINFHKQKIVLLK
ncbi:MAG: T9SS type A sorting domain-containing protein [Candidatus Delongbacteria bacterium]|nr:T9SS type A sorting domain-containing protein [Candidatus Delongbacteria bacterium]MBN2836989.1 T9SS type A sorting domain-containing protein [Candidatus Delongbacteria bacterium]